MELPRFNLLIQLPFLISLGQIKDKELGIIGRSVVNKISNTSRGKKGLLIIGLAAILLLIVMILKEPSIDRDGEGVIGEVWGRLEVEGEITSNTSYSSQEFGIYDHDEYCGTVVFTFSNLSRVTVIERERGGAFEKEYLLANRTFSFVLRRGWLYCDLVNGTMDLEIREIYGEPKEEWKYQINTDCQRIDVDAYLEHSYNDPYDICTSRVTAYVNDEILNLTRGAFNIPEDEVAHVSIGGHGTYVFESMPTIKIDGTLRVEDFTEITEEGLTIKRYHTLVFEGNGILLSTIQKPNYIYEGLDEYHVPWIVRVHSESDDRVTVESSADPLFAILLMIVLLLFLILIHSIVK